MMREPWMAAGSDDIPNTTICRIWPRSRVRTPALEADDAPMTARVRSAELVGKHLGMFTEKVSVTSTPPPPMRLVIVRRRRPRLYPRP